MGPTLFWLDWSCWNLAKAQDDAEQKAQDDEDKHEEQDTRHEEWPIGAARPQRSGIIGKANGKGSNGTIHPRRSGWMEKAATMASLYEQGKYYELQEYIQELSEKFPQFQKCKKKPYNRF